jgi:hypothetical protein
MKKQKKTKQCFCKSYYDGESDTVKDCTCGKCETLISKKFNNLKSELGKEKE